MKVLAIIQARMGSTRLPGKVLAEINGRPLIGFLIDRLRSVPEIDHIVVATTTTPSDDVLAEWLCMEGVDSFRGDSDDVLARFYLCAKKYNPDLVVRVTADDPLKDPSLISEAINHFSTDHDLDYCSNTLRPTYPEGLDIEVFRLKALKYAFEHAKLTSEREHVTPYIWKNTSMFKVKNFEFREDLSAWRWTVDKQSDLNFIRAVLSPFQDSPLVSFEEIICFLKQNTDLLKINADTLRNEGYIKSLEMEKNVPEKN